MRPAIGALQPYKTPLGYAGAVESLKQLHGLQRLVQAGSLLWLDQLRPEMCHSQAAAEQLYGCSVLLHLQVLLALLIKHLAVAGSKATRGCSSLQHTAVTDTQGTVHTLP